MRLAEDIAGEAAAVREGGEACDGSVDLQARGLGAVRRAPQPHGAGKGAELAEANTLLLIEQTDRRRDRPVPPLVIPDRLISRNFKDFAPSPIRKLNAVECPTRGVSNSCGCLNSEIVKARSLEYAAWRATKFRCYNKNDRN
jgi:hypothetical protein